MQDWQEHNIMDETPGVNSRALFAAIFFGGLAWILLIEIVIGIWWLFNNM